MIKKYKKMKILFYIYFYFTRWDENKKTPLKKQRRIERKKKGVWVFFVVNKYLIFGNMADLLDTSPYEAKIILWFLGHCSYNSLLPIGTSLLVNFQAKLHRGGLK